MEDDILEPGPAPVDQTVITTNDDQGQAPDWLAGVDPEIARDPSLKVFNNPQDLIKSYVHAQKMLGKDKAVLPGKNSTEIEWKQFYNKIGLPEDVNDYKIDRTDKYVVEDHTLEEFKELAFANNLLPGQAQKIMDWFNDKASNGLESSYAQQEQEMVGGWENLQKEWGQGFDANVSAAKSVVREFGDEAFVDYLNESGMGDNPQLTRFLAQIGRNLREDSFNDATIAQASMTPQEAKSAYAKIIGDRSHPYTNSQHPDHANAVMEVNKLFEKM